MAEQLKTIEMPQLGSGGFATGLQQMINNINKNFLQLQTLPLTRGDAGDSMVYVRLNPNVLIIEDLMDILAYDLNPLTRENDAVEPEATGNQLVDSLTETCYKVVLEVRADYIDWCTKLGLNYTSSTNYNSYFEEVSAESKKILTAIRAEFDTEGEDGEATHDYSDLHLHFEYNGETIHYELVWMWPWLVEDSGDIDKKSFISDYLASYKMPTLVVMGLKHPEGFEPVNTLSYSFIDMRWRNENVNKYTEIVNNTAGLVSYQSPVGINDHSCVVYGEAKDDSIEYIVIDAFPRMKYTDNGVTMVVNGHDTGTSAAGQKGDKGDNANLYVVQRMENIHYTDIKVGYDRSGSEVIWQTPMGAITVGDGYPNLEYAVSNMEKLADGSTMEEASYDQKFNYSTDGRVVMNFDESYKAFVQIEDDEEISSGWLGELNNTGSSTASITINNVKYNLVSTAATTFANNYYRVWGISGGKKFWRKPTAGSDTNLIPVSSGSDSEAFSLLEKINGSPCLVMPAWEHRADEYMTYFWLSTITVIKYTSVDGDVLYIPVVYCGPDNLINLAMDNTSFAGLMMALDPYEQRYINEEFPRRHRPRGLMLPISSRWAPEDDATKFATHIIYSDAENINWNSYKESLSTTAESATGQYVGNKRILHVGSILDYRTLDDVKKKYSPAIPGRKGWSDGVLSETNAYMVDGAEFHVDEPMRITMYRDTMDILGNNLLTVEGNVIIGGDHYNGSKIMLDNETIDTHLMHVDRSKRGGGLIVYTPISGENGKLETYDEIKWADASVLDDINFAGGYIGAEIVEGVTSNWLYTTSFVTGSDEGSYLKYDNEVLRSAGANAIFDFENIQVANHGDGGIGSIITKNDDTTNNKYGLNLALWQDNDKLPQLNSSNTRELISTFTFDIDSTIHNGGVIVNGYPDSTPKSHAYLYGIQALSGLYVGGSAVERGNGKYIGNNVKLEDTQTTSDYWPNYSKFGSQYISLYNQNLLRSAGSIWTDQLLHVNGVNPSAILLGSGNFTESITKQQVGGEYVGTAENYLGLTSKTLSVKTSPIILDLGPAYRANRLVKFGLITEYETGANGELTIKTNTDDEGTPKVGSIFFGQFPSNESNGGGEVSSTNFIPSLDATSSAYGTINTQLSTGDSSIKSQAFANASAWKAACPEIFSELADKYDGAPANAWKVQYYTVGNLTIVKLYVLCGALTNLVYRKHKTAFRHSKITTGAVGLGIAGLPNDPYANGGYKGGDWNRGDATNLGFYGRVKTNAQIPTGCPKPLTSCVAQWGGMAAADGEGGSSNRDASGDSGIQVELNSTDGYFYVTSSYEAYFMYRQSDELYNGKNKCPYIELTYIYQSGEATVDDSETQIKAKLYRVNSKVDFDVETYRGLTGLTWNNVNNGEEYDHIPSGDEIPSLATNYDRIICGYTSDKAKYDNLDVPLNNEVSWLQLAVKYPDTVTQYAWSTIEPDDDGIVTGTPTIIVDTSTSNYASNEFYKNYVQGDDPETWIKSWYKSNHGSNICIIQQSKYAGELWGDVWELTYKPDTGAPQILFAGTIEINGTKDPTNSNNYIVNPNSINGTDWEGVEVAGTGFNPFKESEATPDGIRAFRLPSKFLNTTILAVQANTAHNSGRTQNYFPYHTLSSAAHTGGNDDYDNYQMFGTLHGDWYDVVDTSGTHISRNVSVGMTQPNGSKNMDIGTSFRGVNRINVTIIGYVN